MAGKCSAAGMGQSGVKSWSGKKQILEMG